MHLTGRQSHLIVGFVCMFIACICIAVFIPMSAPAINARKICLRQCESQCDDVMSAPAGAIGITPASIIQASVAAILVPFCIALGSFIIALSTN